MRDYKNQFAELKNIISYPEPTSDEISKVEELLGRTPDGLKRIKSINNRIITVLSDTIVRTKPFPTLFWLVDKEVSKEISRIEATGYVKELESSTEIQEMVSVDNLNYSKLRQYFHELNHESLSEDDQFYPSIYTSGAGGLGDHSRVRCLHLHMAFHYSVGSNLGDFLIEKYPQLDLK